MIMMKNMARKKTQQGITEKNDLAEEEIDNLHAILQSANKDRPNGCHEMVFTAVCRRYEMQQKNQKDSLANKVPNCSFAHDDATLRRT